MVVDSILDLAEFNCQNWKRKEKKKEKINYVYYK